MSARVMFYVQHLLGVGHLKRASVIARAMVDVGLDVSVVLGGRLVPGIEFDGCTRILLPPVHAADETFKVLLDENETPIDDVWRDHRSARLMFEFESLRPDALVVELFPFGRRMFGFELLPLLTAARAAEPQPAIVCSLRDILVRKADPDRDRKATAFAKAWFDHILVHGDPRLIPIEASYPEIAAAAAKLTYTGYVVDAPPSTRSNSIGDGDVIVSAGGGAVAAPLLQAALAAKPLTRVADRPWRLITGPNFADDAYAELSWSRPPGVIVERWRSDLPAMLRACAVSISQAGYNTVMDVLAARARGVLVPFAAAGETEQSLRARVLADRGLCKVVDPDRLSPGNLAAAVDEALTLDPPCVEIDCDGAETTARFLQRLCDRSGAAHG